MNVRQLLLIIAGVFLLSGCVVVHHPVGYDYGYGYGPSFSYSFGLGYTTNHAPRHWHGPSRFYHHRRHWHR